MTYAEVAEHWPSLSSATVDLLTNVYGEELMACLLDLSPQRCDQQLPARITRWMDQYIVPRVRSLMDLQLDEERASRAHDSNRGRDAFSGWEGGEDCDPDAPDAGEHWLGDDHGGYFGPVADSSLGEPLLNDPALFVAPASGISARASWGNPELWRSAFPLLAFPEKLAAELCRSLGAIQEAQRNDDPVFARGCVGQAVGHYLFDVRCLLVEANPNNRDLSIRVWWRIEPAVNRIRARARAVLDGMPPRGVTMTRVEAAAILSDVDALAKATQDEIAPPERRARPTYSGIKRWERVAEYIEVFGDWTVPWPEPRDGGAKFDPGYDPEGGEDPESDRDAVRICLEEACEAFGLSADEIAALELEYIEGVPPGLSNDEFKARFGYTRQTLRNRVRSALPKLGRCVRKQLGDD